MLAAVMTMTITALCPWALYLVLSPGLSAFGPLSPGALPLSLGLWPKDKGPRVAPGLRTKGLARGPRAHTDCDPEMRCDGITASGPLTRDGMVAYGPAFDFGMVFAVPALGRFFV
jgi:hypothetical protein